MKEEAVTDALLREYLLGKLIDQERDRIESEFLTDAQARERILAVEEDLIEDYLEESLATADRDRFRLVYARTAEQRRKLKITKSIKDWAITQTLPQTIPAKFSAWGRVRGWWHAVPATVPIAVAVVITFVLVAIWLNMQIEQRSRQHSAIEQELAQLNSLASLSEVPSHMTSLVLSPMTLRSAEEQTNVGPIDRIQIVELRLPWIQKQRYSKYQVEVRRVGNDESFIIRNLQAEGDGQSVIRVRLPAHLLHRGDYKIQLNGTAIDGSTSPPEEYQFAVSG